MAELVSRDDKDLLIKVQEALDNYGQGGTYLAENIRSIIINHKPEQPPQISTCGGCQGLGGHRRWCKNKVGLAASIYGPMAERLNSMGDSVGPNNMELSNSLWSLSAYTREWAKSLIVKED